ncbi:helix-turn-helix domain-containing protein [Tunturiibacter empetritectus]|uniref:GlxA family transcriptional regulator n=1 Tax=Tunturiibacter empetritectus TaxID=3069691 RepID=UPI003D9B80CB
MRKVVIIGPSPVQILDVTGPFEVFSNAPDYEIQLANPGLERTLQTNRGVVLAHATPIADVRGPIDTLVIVGGPGAESGSYDPNFIVWIAKTARQSRRVASICTGAFLLAEAGLLDGKQAVTHWNFCDRLARSTQTSLCGPSLSICATALSTHRQVSQPELTSRSRWSKKITDMKQLSRSRASSSCSSCVRADKRNTVTCSPIRPSPRSHCASFKYGCSNTFVKTLPLSRLAERIGMSARHFTRVCLRETGMNPGQFVDRMRVEAAQQIIDSSSRGLKEIADSCGFKSADAMRRTFLRVLGVTAAEYVSRFKSTLARGSVS